VSVCMCTWYVCVCVRVCVHLVEGVLEFFLPAFCYAGQLQSQEREAGGGGRGEGREEKESGRGEGRRKGETHADEKLCMSSMLCALCLVQLTPTHYFLN